MQIEQFYLLNAIFFIRYKTIAEDRRACSLKVHVEKLGHQK